MIDPEQDDILGAVNEGVAAADNAGLNEQARRLLEAEQNVVKALFKEYEEAREFDKDARAQYAVDRRYAAGTANPDWAVTSNLIGAFIDILVSFLYARNPDVSVRKAPRVKNTGTSEEDDFARTLELVISALWRAPSARLKPNLRSQVRSTLSVSTGWFKAIMVSTGTNIPQLRNELNDSRRNLEMLEAVRTRLSYQQMPGQEAPPPPPPSPTGESTQYDCMSLEEIDVERQKLIELETSLSNRLEVALRKGLAVDFMSSEDVQVSLDVRSVADYPNAGWIANAIYRPISALGSMFPRLTEADVKKAKCYYQRRVKDLTPLADQVRLTGLADSSIRAEEAEQYTAGERHGTENGIAFGKVIEVWDRNTGHVRTLIDGVDRWAKEPYQPDYPTTRFFPYFMIAFYPVDGARHPQSLSNRLAKLQDEYASTRSSLRLTRQRAVPGTLFNSSAVDEEAARKIERSQHQEFIGLKPTNPEQPLRDLFTEKPIAVGDMRLFDTSAIISDMERISGVQEALQSTTSVEKTATEAEFQQAGFASRTTADRDVLEDVLTEFAQYTAELAISALDGKDAERIAGAGAYWPHGMSIDDLLTMVEVKIEAGTTGKPKSKGDREAWGVVLPLIKETMLQVREALVIGDQPMADALIAVLQETLNRMGDETDVSRFVPQLPAALPGAVPGAPGAVPGATGAVPGAPGAVPGAPGAVPEIPGEQPDGSVIAPELAAPLMMEPTLQPPIV
jgi:hypothetical protein